MSVLTAKGQVKLVAWCLSLLGAFTLLCGIMLQGATVVGDRQPETGAKAWLGFAMIGSGALAFGAGLQNSRFKSWWLGVAALASLLAPGLLTARLINPYTVVMIYGLAVYLSPPGRRVFHSSGPPTSSG